MARRKLQALALKWGHPTTFRKTVTVGPSSNPEQVQLVFEPGVKYLLSASEVSQLQRFVDSGLLVDPGKDVKGRYKDCREVGGEPEPEPAPEAEASEAAEE